MIHPTAIIAKGASIAPDVFIGPYSVIGEHVSIDSGTWIGSHVVIDGHTKIGKKNKIYQFASVGVAPQHKLYADEVTFLEIGDENTIREYCSIHRGTVQGGNFTKIGHRNLLMAYVHIAHDCILQNDIILANSASLAGHVLIGNWVVLGGFVKVLQFCSLGDYSFVSGNTDIIKDILPYTLVSGQHGDVKSYGLNLVGLRRRGFTVEILHALKHAYNIICRKNLTVEQAIPQLEAMSKECQEVQLFIDMLKTSKRGIIR